MLKFLKNLIGHFRTICVHKFWVGYYCFKAKLYWRGLVHDMSKFHPVEFFESVKYYQGDRSPIDKCKEVNGYSKAWLHHKGRNRHHYEYWCDNFDKGTTCIKMPFTDMLELVCDYLGAGRAYMGKEFTYEKEYEWWKSWKCPCSKMHDESKQFLTTVLKKLAEGVDPDVILGHKKYFKKLYEKGAGI